jgi:glutathione S-transferase
VPSITLPDGTHLYESRPICKYLSQTHNFPLLPHPKTSTPLEQALFNQAISAETCYFFPPAGRISYQKGLPLFGGQTDETAVEEARKEVSMHFGILEGVLVKQDGEFMGGKEWSLVDIFYIPVVQRLIDVGEGEAIFGEDGEGKGNVRVKNWWGRCLEREPVKKFVDEMLKFEDVKKRLEARKKREEEAAAAAAEGNKL